MFLRAFSWVPVCVCCVWLKVAVDVKIKEETWFSVIAVKWEVLVTAGQDMEKQYHTDGG